MMRSRLIGIFAVAIGLISLERPAFPNQRNCDHALSDRTVNWIALGDLTQQEITNIQQVSDGIDWPIVIVGSAARSARRFPGTDRPIGKHAEGRSDIDYVIPMVSKNERSEQMTVLLSHLPVMTGLPDVDPQPWHGVLRGIPAIMIDRIWFFPRTKPVFVPLGEPNPQWNPDAFGKQ